MVVIDRSPRSTVELKERGRSCLWTAPDQKTTPALEVRPSTSQYIERVIEPIRRGHSRPQIRHATTSKRGT
jgi:hypothetical protein